MAEILQYVPGSGIFHRLHPITKIFFIVLMSVVTILTASLPMLLGILLFTFLLAGIGRLLRPVIQQMVLIMMMSIVIYLITILTVAEGTAIAYLVPAFIPVIGGMIPVTVGALMVGTVLTLRFAILISAFQLFVISTQPRDLVHTMERARIPVDYTLMFLIALRFIPTLQMEGMRIHEAQLARGFEPGSGVRGRARALMPLLIPIVSNALARAHTLGLTIEMRGYRNRRQTQGLHRKAGMIDYGMAGILGAAFLLFFILG